MHDVECRDDSEHHNYIVTTRHFTMTLILQATMQTSAASEKVNFDETDRHAADCLEHHSSEIKHKNPMSVYVDGSIFFFENLLLISTKLKLWGGSTGHQAA